jgi:glycosyltransferase involved in cell wall biosynthesis
MRILMLSNLYPPYFLGGYELLCRDVTEALHERGYDVGVLTSDHGGSGDPRPYPVWRTLSLTQPLSEDPRTSLGRRVALTRNNAERARYALHEFQPDVVFAWNQNRITLGPLYEVQAQGIPVALTLNDEHMRQFAPAELDGTARRALRRCVERYVEPRLTFESLDLRHTTCISAALARNLAQHGFPSDRLQVIHQGVPLDRFPPRAEQECLAALPTVLYAGGLHADKGVAHLIRAVGRLHAQGMPARLRVVGSGSPADEACLQALAAECCPPGAVVFEPRVPREALPAIYREADVFAFPSVWEEPFGLTHLEAMASGVPVVATGVGGCLEFLEHERNALVVPPADDDALAVSLGRVLGDDGLRRRLIEGGLRTVREKLNLERYVDALVALLERATAASARRAA